MTITSELKMINPADVFVDRAPAPADWPDRDKRRLERVRAWLQEVLDIARATGKWPEDLGLPVASERTHTRGPQGERYSLFNFEHSQADEKALIAEIRAANRETYGTGRLRSRWHRCHEIAQKAVIFGGVPDGTILIQGACIIGDGNPSARPEYSWLELPDGRTWEPVTCRYGYLRAVSLAGRYDYMQAVRKSNETDIWGWWS